MGALVVIPDSVRSMVQAITLPYDIPQATDDLRRFVDGLDPHTTPAAEDLIEVILVWIATAEPRDPRLPAWTGYARRAARRLHPDDHYRARRAALADTAVSTPCRTTSPRREPRPAPAPRTADVAPLPAHSARGPR